MIWLHSPFQIGFSPEASSKACKNPPLSSEICPLSCQLPRLPLFPSQGKERFHSCSGQLQFVCTGLGSAGNSDNRRDGQRNSPLPGLLPGGKDGRGGGNQALPISAFTAVAVFRPQLKWAQMAHFEVSPVPRTSEKAAAEERGREGEERFGGVPLITEGERGFFHPLWILKKSLEPPVGWLIPTSSSAATPVGSAVQPTPHPPLPNPGSVAITTRAFKEDSTCVCVQ